MIMVATTSGWTASGPITDDISWAMKLRVEGDLDSKAPLVTILALVMAFMCGVAPAQQSQPKGVYSFGPDQTIADITKLDWAPLKLPGLPEGIEIAALRGDLAKGGGEILLRTPPGYVVPNHSHTSDEIYVWLKGAFTYIAADGKRQPMSAPAYISLPGQTPHGLECGNEQCVFYLRYGRPFDLEVHAMPPPK
jgi:quercetin dioxygenase-like cupin family protein